VDRPTPGIAAVPWGAAVREPGEGWDESNPVPATTLTLVEGATFVIASATGDIDPGGVEGLFVGDTRICSALQLRIDDHVVEPLTSAPRSPSSAAFVGRTIDRQLVFRDLSVGRGMRVDLRVRNLAGTHREVEVALRMDTDLAGLFEVKTRSVIVPPVPRRADGATLRFADADGHRGLTAIGSEGAVAGEDGTIRWRVPLDAGREWSGCVEFRALRGGHDVASAVSCDAPLTAPKGIARMDETPRCHTDVPGLATAIRRAGEDLGALQIEDPDHPEDVLVAAGAPWYMTLFGRDSILTSWMALVLDPDMAFGTVRALARLQGREDVPETEEQPGRILHEIRSSSGASLALADGHIYYGSIDATPLFVMLVHELWRWGAGAARIQELMPALDAALAWQERRFDAGEGYLSYRAAVPGSLVNQSWKDSHDAIGFADGRLADPPIATAEVQAYAFAAWRAGAALARAFGDPGTAEERDRRAEDLRSRFARDFWLEDRGAVALALDGAGRQVDAVASNMGHCLWTGIVDEPAQAVAIARWLVSPELASGWGVRTLATSMARHSPLSYHNGSVWPHDTAIAIAGLRRAGFVEEAHALSRDLLLAADALGGRLPELFAGLTAEEMVVPVRYPTSCSPQAWASAAPLLVLRALLGLEPDVPTGHLALDPRLPEGSGHLRIEGLPLAGAHLTIDVRHDGFDVTGLPAGTSLATASD